MPMVFWLNDSDLAIQAVCWAGAGLSLMLVFNLLPRLSLVLIYALYLSLLYAGQTFMNFQWDTFLLETAVVALLMSFRPTTGVWLARWLLFRFMFMSGVVKLISGDPNWRNLSALSYHFLTQPLPTPLAWYAAQLPASLLKAATGAMFVVELVLPFLIFFPRRLTICRRVRHSAAARLHSPDRQLQLVQSSNHVALPAAVRRRGAASGSCRLAFSSSRRRRAKPEAATGGDDLRQRSRAHDGVLKPRPDGRAIRRQPAWAGAGDR